METELECKESIFGCLFSFWFVIRWWKMLWKPRFEQKFQEKKTIFVVIGFVSFGCQWWPIIEIGSNEFRNEKNNRKKGWDDDISNQSLLFHCKFELSVVSGFLFLEFGVWLWHFFLVN